MDVVMHRPAESSRSIEPPQHAAAQPWELCARWAAQSLQAEATASLGKLAPDKLPAAASAPSPARIDDINQWWTQNDAMPWWDGQADLDAAVALADRISFEFASDHLLVLLGQEPN